MLFWPEFKFPPINLWVMPPLRYSKDFMREKDKQWLRDKMPWVTDSQCEAFAERIAIMACDKYVIDENNLKKAVIKSMEDAGLL